MSSVWGADQWLQPAVSVWNVWYSYQADCARKSVAFTATCELRGVGVRAKGRVGKEFLNERANLYGVEATVATMAIIADTTC